MFPKKYRIKDEAVAEISLRDSLYILRVMSLVDYGLCVWRFTSYEEAIVVMNRLGSSLSCYSWEPERGDA